jgi:hypothetical protein
MSMTNFDHITEANFKQSFDIHMILKDSVFYPASGVDPRHVECFMPKYNSFVHVDYSISEQQVRDFMQYSFHSLGYRLIGLMNVTRQMITPQGFRPAPLELNEYEKERLQQNDSIRKSFQGIGFRPFALWGLYEKNTGSNAQRFSLFHIGGEACASFEALYVGHCMNPTGICIISPAEGFGANWTIFRDPGFRLHQLIRNNHLINNIPLPAILLTNMILTKTDPCFWPEYGLPDDCDISSDLIRWYLI